MSDVMFYGVLRMPYEMAMDRGEISRRQFYQRAQEAANRVEQAEYALEVLRAAVGDLLKSKGCFNTEKNYDALQAAYDITGPNVQSAISGAAKAYQESTQARREKIDAAIKAADSIIAQHRDSRDRRKVDIPYQASGLPDRRQSDRRNKPRG